ncbi:ABC transporter permease [Gorillibacterium timonense]|uniref:ABC transporter permease n=1 Tax=Gorillibacterium timonense TaxID=1689269 RepID=UPI00071D7ADC|nr:ABC transporter permease [Gorillibacterium timonense]
MFYRIIRNDIWKSKAVTLTTLLFVAAAAMLVSLAAVLIVNVSGSIDTLMTKAKTPHFMQMHSGVLDTERLEAFAEQQSNVEDYQSLSFLNMDGSQIVINGKSFADNVQDNGLSTQSQRFDFLLDLNGQVISAKDGELYVPIGYRKEGLVKVGDKAVIAGKEFHVAGFLRDSQMNSLLASSKRFLMSEHDYAEVKEFGSIEYLIEFRLKDLSKLGDFQTAYTAAGLEAGGPTVTYPLFRMLNALSDGLMIAVILLVSVLVVAIAFLCVRFTLLAKIEDDYREIGVMKAIGLRISDIKARYLAKYAVIAGAGSIVGFALSFVFKGMLLENIRLSMGESENSSFALLFGIIGVLLVFLAMMAYVRRVLRHFRKISAAGAIRFGTSQDKAAGAKPICLSRNRWVSTNVFLGIKEVLARKRLYGTLLVVLVLSTFIMLVPHNLYNTISSKGFVTYMGIGKSDIRFDIQQTDHIPDKAAAIATALEKDRSVARSTVLTTKPFQVKKADGSEERIRIELGDHSVFPVAYSDGRAPVADHEIALSVMNAQEFDKKVGDTLTLVTPGKERTLTICGVYSDITNGGKTAKAAFTDHSTDPMWSVVYAELSDLSLVSSKVSDYAKTYEFAKVSSIEEYKTQTFGSTIDSVGKASYVAIAAALLVMALITLLFMNMLVAKNRPSIAIMKALGFNSSDIRTQYASRSVFVLLVGILLGTLLANTLGERLAGAVISSFGAASFTFAIHPLTAYGLYPLLMIGTVLIATRIGTASVSRTRIAEHIKE